MVDGDTVLFSADVVPSDSEGDHLVSFTPKISGTYGLVLLFDGARQLSGSPFKIRVKADETMAANCKLYGPGLTRAVAGERTSFSIKGSQAVPFTVYLESCCVIVLPQGELKFTLLPSSL